MQIKPERQKYLQWKAISRRAPIWGEKHIPQLNPASLYSLLFANSSNSFLFESRNGPPSTARFSLMGSANTKTLRPSSDGDGFAQLNFSCNLQDDELPEHFWGGWVGYLGYECAALLEHFPRRNKDGLNIPDACFMQVDRLAVYDHQKGLLKFILSPDTQGSDYDLIRDEIVQTWDRIESAGASLQETHQDTVAFDPKLNCDRSKIHPVTSKSDYMAMVDRAKEYIAAGDIYQANLAQQFKVEFTDDPFNLYLRLRAVNPSPFSGFFKIDGLALISSSPERLVKLDGRHLETRPIAGTRPRGKTLEQDRQMRQELLLNEKEMAEHMMLVDLERNDMGRICTFGSVQVSDLMFLEQYSHVNHIVSNIVGTLKPGIDVADVLQAIFPGGTITGCPKIRCMEIIDELEPMKRGPYSGSMGYIGWTPVMDLNIIIRTIVVHNNIASFHVGAGIVADSNPEREYEETLAKAEAMMEVLSSRGKE